jgi:hypothetical protein
MGVIQSGGAPTVYNYLDKGAIVSQSNQSLRVNARPVEIVGSYRQTIPTGTITCSSVSASNGVMYTFKYVGTGLCLIRSASIGGTIVASGLTTTGTVQFSMYKVANTASFTQGTTNGTGYGTGQANGLYGKKRTSMPSPNVSIVAYNGTGAGITGDSASSEETYPFSRVAMFSTASTVTTIPQNPDSMLNFIHNKNYPYVTQQQQDPTSYPLVLAPNEGFRIKNDLAYINGTTGSGTLILALNVEWDEVLSTTY